ncbi:BrnA antitoxin family protein [Lichenifustis flavocetrariae]|uniref:BrnA antitoxin family protein n=1 Tax=Lichenifustis flavocetrariae TaxID=2949735 RepID=A0AA42CM48_9HYPH|nr:BrnA antitoxin family protein [Lichenifustis flavocetrariae]MCW6512304.1 BrnA antitoxin family protein [Lichenifustis flavocetrariae]
MPKQPLTDKDGEVRELTAADFEHARPIAEAAPGMIEAMQRFKKRVGRPSQADTPKVHVGFRMAADVVDGIKATGKGYNARVEQVLREALASGRFGDLKH